MSLGESVLDQIEAQATEFTLRRVMWTLKMEQAMRVISKLRERVKALAARRSE